MPNREREREGYCRTAESQSNLLDKTIISASWATFTITMGFINTIIPIDTAKHLWLLWIAISILGLTIILTTLSFWAAENAAKKWIAFLDVAEEKVHGKNNWSKLTTLLNGLRLTFFVSGITMLVVFILCNGIWNTKKSQNIKIGGFPAMACTEIVFT